MNPEKAGDCENTPEAFAAEIPDGAVPEIVVEKTTFDGFQNTILEQVLRRHGIEQVLVAGLVTSACVLMTSHGAFSRGFRVALVEDCLGDRTIEKQKAILSIYGGYMFQITSNAEVGVPQS
mmetsp:Transcript_52581/g.122995  ORF Transcript_52581/g.122995 Transcript_52581/m.122995 type:complete len:121 (+) Transcript_52581:274-636(+)